MLLTWSKTANEENDSIIDAADGRSRHYDVYGNKSPTCGPLVCSEFDVNVRQRRAALLSTRCRQLRT